MGEGICVGTGKSAGLDLAEANHVDQAISTNPGHYRSVPFIDPPNNWIPKKKGENLVVLGRGEITKIH